MLLTERLTHGGAPGRRRGPRAEQSAGHHRRLRGGAASRGCTEASPLARRRSRLPRLPRPDRGGGVSLQGDHRQPAAVRPRARQPAGARPTSTRWSRRRSSCSRTSRGSRAAGSRRSWIPPCPLVTVNEGQMRQVFLGLAANALEAMEAGGTPDHPLPAPARTRSRSSSRTRGRELPTTCWRASSTRSSPRSRRARGRGSAWPSRRASSPTTAGGSR